MSKDASGQVDPKKTNGEKRVKRGRLHFTEEEVTQQDKEQASGQLGPRSSFCLTGWCLLSGGLRRLKARLSGPPILGVVPLDRSVNIFLKGGLVFDTLGDLPELFV